MGADLQNTYHHEGNIEEAEKTARHVLANKNKATSCITRLDNQTKGQDATLQRCTESEESWMELLVIILV